MEKMYSDKSIYSIEIDGFVAYVGQTFTVGGEEIVVSRIDRDESNHYFFGRVANRIICYKKKDPEKKQFIWKMTERPATITFDLKEQ